MKRTLAPLTSSLREGAQRLERLSEKLDHHPKPSLIHDLRVVSRRLRAVLWLLKRSSTGMPLHGIDRELRHLGRMLGAVRELDVAIQDSKRFRLKGLPVRRQRKKKLGELIAYWNEKRRTKVLRKLGETLRNIRAKKRIDPDPAFQRLRERLTPWREKTLRGDGDLHLLRIEVKKARYVLEAMQQPVPALRELQSVLGRAHDLTVLKGLLGSQISSRVNRRQIQVRSKAIRLRHLALDLALLKLSAKDRNGHSRT